MEITGKVFDEERALYNLQNALLVNCEFSGPADGESALKEARGIELHGCVFSLRYPLWHTSDFKLIDSRMEQTTRAPLWYARNGLIKSCTIDGIKCLRECDDIAFESCIVHSPEFGWKCRGIMLDKCSIESEYLLFECENAKISELQMKGKYSFQYARDISIDNSILDTKDAFWHSRNVTVRNSTVKGEYLGWYSDGLKLINCHIIGTQPLCYCKNLTLVNCTMEGTDLSFEYSDVHADISGNIVSVKNPRSGSICADSIGDIILENSVVEANCDITLRRGEQLH